MVEWIISNKEWIFSGLGIAIISAFFAILKTKTPKGGEGNLNVSGDKNVIGDGNILQITNLTEEKQQSNIKIVDISLNEDKEFIVDIKLRNIGDQVAYIKEISFDILDYYNIINPQMTHYQLVESSHTYDVVLGKEKQQVFNVSQSIGANEVDRFQVKLASSIAETRMVTIYYLTLSIIYDEDNLIFMCLKVEAFVQQYQSDVVDIFVIEEPEAHMHPQMERMLIKFLNEILLNEDNNRVQGIITTHSSEIIKCSDLKNIRVLRIDKLLKSAVYDMNLFKQNLETEEERQFFSFLFSINYSDLIFANKVIMYEGDTEKLYIEKLLAEKEFEGLSNQYVSFVQVGGAYTHWYRKLVYFLKIKTLIITDIDYCKKLTSIDEIKDDDGITNAGLIQYYKDYVTVNIIKRDILPYCEHKCRKQLKDCLYEKTEMERISLIQSDFRKKPCPKIKKPDYSIMKKKPTVVDIDSWIKNPDCELIKVVSQGEADAYTRTLEEAMLCKLLGITVESKKSSDWWEKQISINKIKLDIPTRKKNITVRDILNENKNNKTDFMYSIILSELHLKALPNYIREGLIWLM